MPVVRSLREKIRVLFVLKDFGLGATQKTAILLADRLDRRYFQPFLVAINPAGERREQVSGRDTPVFDLDGAMSNLDSILNIVNPNVVMTHFDGDSLIKDLVTRTKAFDHSTVIISHSQFGIYSKAVLKTIDVLTLPSKTLYEKYRRTACVSDSKGVLHPQVQVLYNPVQCTDAIPRSLNIARVSQIRDKYHIPATDFVVGRLARADDRKWSNLLLRATTYLSEDSNIHFIYVGIPKNRIDEFRRIRNCHLIEMLKSEDDLLSFLDSIDVLLHTSRIGETFGVALAEAMSRGVPCVVHRTRPYKKTFRDNAQSEVVDNGVNGLVTPYSSFHLAEGVRELKKNKTLYRQLSAHAIAKAKLFDVGNVARSLEGIIVRALSSIPNVRVDEGAMASLVAGIVPTEEELSQFRSEYDARRKNLWRSRSVRSISVILSSLVDRSDLLFYHLGNVIRKIVMAGERHKDGKPL